MIEPFDKMRDDIISIKTEIDYQLCMVQYGKDIVDKMMMKFDIEIKGSELAINTKNVLLLK